jgi:hydroxymethylbilane synthase
MNKVIRIGTQTNKLAQLRAEYVAECIKPSGYTPEIITIEGDEIAKLLNGSVDILVHSAKELPADMHEELELLAFTQRELPNDVLVSTNKNINLKSGGTKIGTSSIRRKAFIKHFYRETAVVFIGGDPSVQIQKMRDGECDALLVAYADIRHLGEEDLIVETIETSYFVPAAGQGSIAVACHQKLSFDKKDIIQRWVNHAETEDCIRTERAFAKTLNPDYNIPAFAYAHYEGNLITLKAGIISMEGFDVIKVKRSSTVAESKELGKKVVLEVLKSGGEKILQQLQISA